MIHAHIIPPEGEIRHEDLVAAPTLNWMRDRIGGGYVEYVSVLYQGRPTTMLVDEEGATNFRPGYPLPVNERATEIYWEASRRRGVRHDHNSPRVYGTAVVLEGYFHKDNVL